MSGCACKTQERAIPYDKLEAIVEKYKGDSSAVIPILQDVQDLLGYVPKESISFLGEKLDVSPAKIYGIVTFYAQFRLTPRGKHTIMICEGTACHVNGAKAIGRAVTDELGIEDGETTEDGLFTMEKVACVGCCSLAPVMLIDNEAQANMTPDNVRKLLKKYKAEQN